MEDRQMSDGTDRGMVEVQDSTGAVDWSVL